MFPVLSRGDLRNGVSANTELQSDGCVAFSIEATPFNLDNLIFGEFCGVDLGAFPLPSLGNHILIVQGVVSEEKVIGSDAVSNVALVEHSDAIWNWSKMNLPRESVCSNRFGFGSFNGESNIFDHSSIPIPIFVAKEQPATLGFFDEFKKSFLYWDGLSNCLKFVAARARAALLFFRFGVENNSAMETLVLNHKKLALSFIREGVGVITGALNFTKLSTQTTV